MLGTVLPERAKTAHTRERHRVTPQCNQVLFQANVQSPIFSEIKSLITKTVGIIDIIQSSVAPLGCEIQI